MLLGTTRCSSCIFHALQWCLDRRSRRGSCTPIVGEGDLIQERTISIDWITTTTTTTTKNDIDVTVTISDRIDDTSTVESDQC